MKKAEDPEQKPEKEDPKQKPEKEDPEQKPEKEKLTKEDLGIVGSAIVTVIPAALPGIVANPQLGLLFLVAGIGIELVPVFAEDLYKAQKELDKKITAAKAAKPVFDTLTIE